MLEMVKQQLLVYTVLITRATKHLQAVALLLHLHLLFLNLVKGRQKELVGRHRQHQVSEKNK